MPPLVFKVKVSGLPDTFKPEFKWDLSAGTIIKGQGTDEIIIDRTGSAGQIVTAHVELTGAPFGCKDSASITAKIIFPPPTAGCAFDQYGDIKFEDEKARLDNFAIQLFNQPGSSGQILMYTGQRTFKGEAAYRLDRARSYLVNFRGIDSGRIVTLDCGFYPDLSTSLMIVPSGAEPMECVNVGRIPLSEVKFTKPRPRSLKKRSR